MEALCQLLRCSGGRVAHSMLDRAQIGGTDLRLNGQSFLRKSLLFAQSFEVFTKSFVCVQNNPSVYRALHYKV